MENKKILSTYIISVVILSNTGCASLEKSWTDKCYSICSDEFSTYSSEFRQCMAQTNKLGWPLPRKCNNYVAKYHTCDSYGFSRESSSFSSCLMQLDIAESNLEAQDDLKRQINKENRRTRRDIQSNEYRRQMESIMNDPINKY